MKISRLITGTLFLICSPVVTAAVDLQIATGVTVLVENGQDVSAKSVFSRTKSLRLPDGTNQIVARYSAELKGAGNERTLAHSDTFVILFTAKDQRLFLEVPDINTSNALRRFNQTGEWQLRDQQGREHSRKVAHLKKHGFQLDRDYVAELAAFNLTSSPAAMATTQPLSNQGAAQPSRETTQPTASTDGHQSGSTAESMLKYWYQQADTETRRYFKAWIADQES